MSLFSSEVVTPPAHLPITATDETLAAAVVEEIERGVLWRAIVAQTRRITLDGPLPPRIEIEPVSAIVSLTRWTPDDDAAVISGDNYYYVSRDPSGTIIQCDPGCAWPEPERELASFVLTYDCGWVVTPETAANAGDAVNKVPQSIRLMVERALEFRGESGLGDLSISGLDIAVAESYKTDRLPAAIASIGRAWNFRPGLFHA